MNLRVVTAEEVARRLTYDVCIPLMRDAMIALSQGRSRQLLRGIVDLDHGNAFGVMPGALDGAGFGAKLVSVFPGNAARGGLSHQGVVLLFDPETGAPAALVDAGELTAIRTAAASAAATDALARPEARRLAILGTGGLARRHVEAIRRVRAVDHVAIWGRDPAKAAALAADLDAEAFTDVAAAVRDADMICTLTAAPAPILFADQVAPGAHLNLVGSSRAGPAEIEAALVARARFFADHREGVLAQGAEFLNAKAAGLVEDGHILGEIGAVMAGDLPGRLTAADITACKSLGNIVQDLAAASWLLRAPDDDRLQSG